MEINELINKFLEGDLNKRQAEELLNWVNESEENKDYFTYKKNIWVATTKHKGSYLETEKELKRNKRIRKKAYKIKTNSFYVFFQKAAAILIIPIIGIAMYYGITVEEKQIVITKMIKAKTTYKEMSTPIGVRAKLVLPDSSVVWLNSESKLIYPDSFDGGKREVSLFGEAYFDIKENKNKRFIVNSRDVKVRVYGTCFNINAYSEQAITTTLVSGSVKMSYKSSKEVDLTPGYNGIYKYKSNTLLTKKVNTDYYTAWKDGVIIFRDTPMNEVITILEKWFGVTIKVKNQDIEQYRFTARLKNKTLEQILTLLTKSSPMGYSITKNKVVLYPKKKK